MQDDNSRSMVRKLNKEQKEFFAHALHLKHQRNRSTASLVVEEEWVNHI